MLDKLTGRNDILKSAMQASMIKKDVILNNIANADTPGYKKKTVVFDQLLDQALKRETLTGQLSLDKVKPRIETMHEGFSYRLDENNVNMELEMVDLYATSVKYDTMVGSVVNNYKRIGLVVRAR